MNLSDVTDRLTNLKNTTDGEFKELVLRLESALHHVHGSYVENLVKEAVTDEVFAALVKVENILNSLTKAEVPADKAVRKAPTRKTD